MLAELRASGESGDEASLYAALPAYVRGQLTELEFRDLLRRLEQAGQVTRPEAINPAARRKRLRLPLHRL